MICIGQLYYLFNKTKQKKRIVSYHKNLEGTLEFNVDGSFIEGFGCLGVGGVVRNHDGDWIADFSPYEVGGDALLVDQLRVIEMCLDFCCNRGYNNIICESDSLEAVEIFVACCDHTLHTYVINIVHIRYTLYGNDDNTTLAHVLRK